jgi:hypothetical protein
LPSEIAVEPSEQFDAVIEIDSYFENILRQNAKPNPGEDLDAEQ